MKSTDNQLVTVSFSSPVQEMIDGWIEVRGVGQGKSNVRCQHYLQLPADIMGNFGEF